MNIFFDVDGVLIDGFHYKPEKRVRWDKDIEKDFGIDPKIFQTLFTNELIPVYLGKAELKPVLQEWLDTHGYTHDAAVLIDYWMTRDSLVNKEIMDLVKVLSKVPGISLHVATNQEHTRAQYLWENLSFKLFFKEMFHSARLGHFKQDPQYFEKIMNHLGLQAGDTIIYFDDDPRNIETAQCVGWNAVLFEGPTDVTSHPLLAAHFH